MNKNLINVVPLLDVLLILVVVLMIGGGIPMAKMDIDAATLPSSQAQVESKTISLILTKDLVLTNQDGTVWKEASSSVKDKPVRLIVDKTVTIQSVSDAVKNISKYQPKEVFLGGPAS